MPRERLVKATFSNGQSFERGSITKVYTHAYLAEGHCPINPAISNRSTGRWRKFGFSTSEAQARKNMDAETAWYRNNASLGYSRDFAEVVAVESIEKRTRESA